MENKEVIAGYQIFGELIEFIGDSRWDTYLRHKNITEGTEYDL